ncbi:kinase-like protein [Mycena sanguinolenta]|nr:kinase-like protein [Mycena sanguinolenta]
MRRLKFVGRYRRLPKRRQCSCDLTATRRLSLVCTMSSAPTTPIYTSRVYADANAQRGKAWYEYNKFRIEWSAPDRYEIVRRLGGGRYSEVFEGVDTVNSERCVLKVLKPVAGHKIKREIKVLRNIAGAPNCIALLDVVRDPSKMYHTLVTEFVDSTEWNQLYTRLTDTDIRHYMFQLLTALDFVHSHGIIHRDIKPANMMIDHPRRQLRVIDWGLAEFYHPGTEYHVRVGSRQYKPPELLVGYKRYEYSLDLWSTGCVFAAMIFRKQHFFRGADNEDQLLKILRVLGTDRFDAYLKAYDIPYETDVEELLGVYPPRPWARFITPETAHLATPDALVLLDRLLRFDPRERWTAKEAMECAYFGTVRVEGSKPEPIEDSGFASMSGDESVSRVSLLSRT